MDAPLKSVAIVGISHDESNESNKIARYMKERGYKIIPINPVAAEILGEKCYPSLGAAPPVDIVDVFRPSSEVMAIAREAVAMKEKYGKPLVFRAQSIENGQARAMLEREGIFVVEKW
ncbi:MAG: CoA-binding protein [Candidatus Aenigmarchaeota archaeon]|nr:CoA-binding protein [Candidatus Aenigmarchaeota archaeon]